VRVARTRLPALRAGTVAVWAALMITFLAGMTAFAVDVGWIALVRNHLQVSADAGAMAGAGALARGPNSARATAKDVAGSNYAGGQGDYVVVPDSDVVLGMWNPTTGVFTESSTSMNAVKVTTRRSLNLFFGAVLGTRRTDVTASAIAMRHPRDIAFVIDMSGSMNNDTEIWATGPINGAFPGYPTIGTDLMTDLFTDFGFGTYPGTTKYVGEITSGVSPTIPSTAWTLVSGKSPIYDFLTKSSTGYLRGATIPSQYKILSTDSTSVQKQKAYSWLIDKQLAVIMPNAKPTPNSSTNLAYWTAYLDYVLNSTVPIPTQSNYRIASTGANPYTDAWPGLDSTAISPYENKVGYLTYVQFMMDHGVDARANNTTTYVPLSRNSPDCPWHTDGDANSPGYQLSFPPREQPTHAVRLAVMAAINMIKALNASLAPEAKDHVCLITFDTAAGVQVKYPLSTGDCDYDAVRASVRDIQAVSDFQYSTASENGLIAARNHLDPATNPAGARPDSDKIIVFLSDGLPNVKSSTSTVINNYITANPSPEWYTSGSWKDERNAVLMQVMMLKAMGWRVHPVGVGLGADRPLMDRMARMAGTGLRDPANPNGPKISAYADGNPADYQTRLTNIFTDILSTPSIKLVK